ncbi:Glycoside hydrolase family 131 protein [Pyrenophora teres f. maculata]|nr:Glycoside hydrolase family 131 protein [Pyrenophora teres f. maculata]
MFGKATLMSALLSAASAEIIWDGRFNDMTSSADLSKWSFASPVGSYQYYIHGSGAVTDYVNLDAKFKNPADTASKQGAKITIDETSKWNGQTMLRTELIPQTKAAINKGKVYYHFSIKASSENAPTTTNEHQLAFFESHFTELKYGASGSANKNLQWHVGGVSKWDVELVADEWHNVAYEIDFDGGSVTFWHSTGSDALKKTAGPFTASTSSNGADWHLGVLRLPGNNDPKGAEDWFFSGVYIEDGTLTTAVGSAAGGAASPQKPAPAASTFSTSTIAAAKTPVADPADAPATPTPTPTPAAGSGSGSAPDSGSSSGSAPDSGSSSGSAPDYGSSSGSAPDTGSGSGSGSDVPLPKEFTIQEFITWFKAKTGKN